MPLPAPAPELEPDAGLPDVDVLTPAGLKDVIDVADGLFLLVGVMLLMLLLDSKNLLLASWFFCTLLLIVVGDSVGVFR